jgi:AcrR family transcriptional regulator
VVNRLAGVAGTTQRTRMAIDTRREQLLDAGIVIFAARQYEDVSIDEIAEACGVSRGLLYHYFSGKREYYVASIGHAAERVREVDPSYDLPPGEQLRDGLERYFATVEQHREAFAAVRRAAAADAEIATIVGEQRRAFAERVLAGMPGTAASSPLAALTARAWIASVEQAAYAWLDTPAVRSADVITVLADSLIAAMLAAARLDDDIVIPPDVADALD